MTAHQISCISRADRTHPIQGKQHGPQSQSRSGLHSRVWSFQRRHALGTALRWPDAGCQRRRELRDITSGCLYPPCLSRVVLALRNSGAEYGPPLLCRERLPRTATDGSRSEMNSLVRLNSPLTKSLRSESIVRGDWTGVRLWRWVGREIVRAT